MIAEAIRRLANHDSLTLDESRALLGSLMDGEGSDAQKAALLIALRMKGETVDEIAGAAIAMRDRVERLDTEGISVVDTCGTGGDGAHTFNISTVAALIAAGAGAVVAKHGNRAVSSACGSADLLAELGVNIDVEASHAAVLLREIGIAFLFAPRMHPAMKALAGVRRELGVRTMFNILGPLTNPALARRQVIGVYALHLVETVAQVLVRLGCDHALVVHSRDGLDEISISDSTLVAEVRDGGVETYELTPEDLGLTRAALSEVSGGDAATNAQIARRVLGGEPGPRHDIAVANAGAALYVAGRSQSLRDGVLLAREAIQSGAALAKLEQLIAATNRKVER